MGINWLVAKGKVTTQTADLDISYCNGKCKQYSFRFSRGAYATKLKNAERILVGANEEETRLYFAPAEGKLGYKVVGKPNENRVVVFISGSKIEATYPTLPPSSVVGTYDLKFDEREKLYYVSIGALPR